MKPEKPEYQTGYHKGCLFCIVSIISFLIIEISQKKSLKTKNLNIFKVRKITEITNFTILTNPYIFSKVRAQYKKFDMKDYPS